MKFLKQIHVTLFTLLLAPICLFAETEQVVDKVAKINEYLDACAQHLKFNGTVLVAEGDNILVNRADGMSNFEKAIPCTIQTRFNLAAVSKLFTAMAIMLLVQKGLVSVNDLITKFMPADLILGDLRAKMITVHHLLTHTAGIKDFEGLPEWIKGNQYNSASEIIKLFKDKPLDFQPGAQFNYSNSGYIVLGYIVEKVSGQSLAQFMKENIFVPPNMKNTGFDYDAADDRFALGYASGKKRVNYSDMSFAYGDGNLISTTHDLYLWIQALSSEKLLRSDLSKMLFAPHVQQGDNTAYGYGWDITELFGHKLICNSGAVPGFSTNIFRFIENDVCIIVLSNSDPMISPVYQMNHDLAAILFGEPYAVPVSQAKKTITVAAAILDLYVGDYKLGTRDMTISIKREANTFYAQITQSSQSIGYERFELCPESETKFFADGDMYISFVKDDQGKVTKFILNKFGSEFVAEKIK